MQPITDQEYLDLVKLWESNDPVDSNEMVDMIEYCIEKFVTVDDDDVLHIVNQKET